MMFSIFVIALGLAFSTFGILYQLFQYLALSLISDPREPHNSKTRGLVLLPSYNDGFKLFRAYESLVGQSMRTLYSSYMCDILVINDGNPSVQQAEALQAISQLDFRLQKDSKNTPKLLDIIRIAQNTGMKSKALDVARTYLKDRLDQYDWIVIMDGDTVLLDTRTLANLVDKLYSQENVAAVSGKVVTKRSLGFLAEAQYSEHIVSYPKDKTLFSIFGKVPVVSGALSIHKTSAVQDIGWWKSGWVVEDVVWTWLALAKGYRVLYEAKSVGVTENQPTLRQLILQRRRWIRGRFEAISECVSQLGWFNSGISYFTIWLVSSVLNSLFLVPVMLVAAWTISSVAFTAVLGAIVSCHVLTMLLSKLSSDLVAKHNQPWRSQLMALIIVPIEAVSFWLALTDTVLRRKKKWMTR